MKNPKREQKHKKGLYFRSHFRIGIHYLQLDSVAFMRFMRGRHPQTILTDIDSGLRDAIASELPNSKHMYQWCSLEDVGVFFLSTWSSRALFRLFSDNCWSRWFRLFG
ncbi:unnamed protein product [Malus baccata var. baccata]